MMQTLVPGQYQDTLCLSDFLVGEDIAWAGETFMFRVTGWSMLPTLRKGDVVELGPSRDIVVGDIVLFRHREELVCHRVVELGPGHEARTRGDDSLGEGERVRRSDVVGKVVAIIRGKRRFQPDRAGGSSRFGFALRGLDRWRERQQERTAAAAVAALQLLLGHRLARRCLSTWIRRSLSFALGVPAPLRMVRAYHFVQVGRFPLRFDLAKTHIGQKIARDLILLAQVGRIPVGTLRLATGELQVRRFATGLGIETHLHAAAGSLREWLNQPYRAPTTFRNP